MLLHLKIDLSRKYNKYKRWSYTAPNPGRTDGRPIWCFGGCNSQSEPNAGSCRDSLNVGVAQDSILVSGLLWLPSLKAGKPSFERAPSGFRYTSHSHPSKPSFEGNHCHVKPSSAFGHIFILMSWGSLCILAAQSTFNFLVRAKLFRKKALSKLIQENLTCSHFALFCKRYDDEDALMRCPS